jgi:ABC-type multidrug transport system ATPase subunit
VSAGPGAPANAGAIVPVVVAGLAKRFGRAAVLRRVDLRLDRGEIVGLIGPNGAGKSTLLTIVAGLLPASGGSLQFGAHEPGVAQGPAVEAALRLRMALVSHTTQLYPRLTPRENLELFARLRAIAGAQTTPSAEALARLRLRTEAFDRPAAALSRGMMQRVALARALAARPELLLLDEPFTALDRDGRDLLVELLRGERARGVATLVASHDLEVLELLCDRIVRIEAGVLEPVPLVSPGSAPSHALPPTAATVGYPA